jgi:predicted ATPase
VTENATTLVLVGRHGAGKTTIGRRLEALLGWPFHEEIGKLLRREAILRDPGAHAFVPQPDFDERVFRLELERDRRHAGTSRIVETWHPGNVAYAEARSPAVVACRLDALRAAAGAPGVLVQPLWIDARTAELRLDEPGPAGISAALGAVADRTLDIVRDWGLPILPAVRNDRCTPDEAARAIIEGLAQMQWGRAQPMPTA